jgi:hypothetical protein
MGLRCRPSLSRSEPGYATDRWAICPAARARLTVSTGGHLSKLIQFKLSHTVFNLQALSASMLPLLLPLPVTEQPQPA